MHIDFLPQVSKLPPLLAVVYSRAHFEGRRSAAIRGCAESGQYDAPVEAERLFVPGAVGERLDR